MTDLAFIPVFRPLLPPADAVAAYLRQADAARFYTNRGPLVRRLEQRLAAALGLPGHAVRTASSGTAAIEVAILAHAGPARADRPLALIPGYTFAATALAAERCGYVPHFVDVGPETWAVDPAALARHPLLARTGLILPVAPFGRMPDMADLARLSRDTGIPVVLDAAAGFEQVLDRPALVTAEVPMAISFHATKTFSTGEGGAILWLDAAGQDRAVQVANFGFRLSRECRIAGTNAKMSEYHAAVGLAMLDGFADRRADYARVAAAWRRLAAGFSLPGRLYTAPEVSSAYVLLWAEDETAFLALETACTAARIETRRWYEAGLQDQPHFAHLGRDAMAGTRAVGRRLLGLPMACDLTEEAIATVLATLHRAAAALPPARAAG